MKTTRGGLVPATLTNTSSGEVVICMFNPHEYTLTKSNQYTARRNMGRNSPQTEFSQGNAQTLKLNLHFDAVENNGDVRQSTDPLWKMMMVDGNTKDPKTKKLVPPTVEFNWGSFFFEAVITNMTQKFTMFAANGTPLRCEVNLTLQEIVDKLDYKDGNVPIIADNVVGEKIAKLSDRADTLTDDATKTRDVMEKNNIDDPLNIPPGTQIRT